MTDYQEVAKIFTAFLRIYKGKDPMGIEQFYKYKTKPLVRVLMGNMNSAVKVDVEQALKDMYSIFKEYRNIVLSKEDWDDVLEAYGSLDQKYEKNRWCEEVMQLLIQMIEDDNEELSGKTSRTFAKGKMEEAA